MGRYFALTLDIGGKPLTKAKPKVPHRRQIANLVGYGIVSMFCLLGLAYLIQTNNLSTKGYEIKKIEQRLLELKETNKRLELEVASLKSAQNLETDTRTLNLVPVLQLSHEAENGYAYRN